MRILVIANPASGVSYHRLIMPVLYMLQSHPEDYAYITNHVTEETFEKGFDIVMMNRSFSTPANQMAKYRDKYGFKLVIDNDDYWNLDPHHVLYQVYKDHNFGQKIEDYIHIADVCTTTHERLADEIYQLNKQVFILPNAIPYGEGQFIDVKEQSEKVRLFWSGSDTHAQDISILKYPMQRVYSDGDIRGKIKTVMAGYAEKSKPVWDVMISAFTTGLRFDSQIYSFSKPENYMFAYCDSDISLIPLLDTKFNSLKSNLKVLETAAKRNPAVVSEVNPYLGMPLCYARTQQYWYRWIKELVNDKAMREEKGNELFEFCNKHHNLKTINEKRYKVICSSI
jgi:uncharacterized protein YneR